MLNTIDAIHGNNENGVVVCVRVVCGMEERGKVPGLSCLSVVVHGIPHLTDPRACRVHHLDTPVMCGSCELTAMQSGVRDLDGCA